MTEAEKKANDAKTEATATEAKAAEAAKGSSPVTNPEAMLVDGDANAKSEANDQPEATLGGKSSEADEEYKKEVNAAVRKAQIDREVQLRLAQSGMSEGAFDTKNPYGLKSGQKVAYEVNGQMVDCDGKSIEKKDSHLASV